MKRKTTSTRTSSAKKSKDDSDEEQSDEEEEEGDGDEVCNPWKNYYGHTITVSNFINVFISFQQDGEGEGDYDAEELDEDELEDIDVSFVQFENFLAFNNNQTFLSFLSHRKIHPENRPKRRAQPNLTLETFPIDKESSLSTLTKVI